jgi:hypothetical protein
MSEIFNECRRMSENVGECRKVSLRTIYIIPTFTTNKYFFRNSAKDVISLSPPFS